MFRSASLFKIINSESQRPISRTLLRGYSSRKHAQPFTEDELDSARKWLIKFDPDTIPKSICDESFSRSAGPGGQNVNKTNSKATLRVNLDNLLSIIPQPLHSEIISSRYHAARSNSLLIQADDSRKQADNLHSCYARLQNLIREAGAKAIPGETTEEKMQRVKKLEKAGNEARLREKSVHSGKKQMRKGGNSD